MVGAGFRLLPRSFRFRWWASGLCAAGLLFLAAGCAQRMAAMTRLGSLPDGRAVAVAPETTTPAGPLDPAVQRASYEPDHAVDLVAPAPVAQLAPPGPTPVSLDAVFRLAEEHNAQIALAREKLNEAQIQSQEAAKGWLPKVTAGVGYFRHEGGIQNEDGTLTRSSFGTLYPGVDLQGDFDIREATYARVSAERKEWEQKGELSRVNNDTLLQAADTYIDLLSARRGEAVAVELENLERDLLKYAESLIPQGGKALVATVHSELSSTSVSEVRLRQDGDGASEKLAYLLGVNPKCPLVPVDETLAPIDLVDATPPTDALVAKALADGPGIHELQGMLAVIDSGMAELSGPRAFLPTLQLCIGEGSFGAGPDSSLAWSNRFDLGIQARWNLTDLLKARDEKRLALSRRRQVELNYEDLREKLTADVREAQEAIQTGRDRVEKAREQIGYASEAYRLNNLRLREPGAGGSSADVLHSLGLLQEAHSNYISAVSEYNKAQIRLLLVVGPAGACKADGPAVGGGAGAPHPLTLPVEGAPSLPSAK